MIEGESRNQPRLTSSRTWALVLVGIATLLVLGLLYVYGGSGGVESGGEPQAETRIATDSAISVTATGDVNGQRPVSPLQPPRIQTREAEEQVSRKALAATSAREALDSATRLPRESLTALSVLDAVERACHPDDLSLSSNDALLRWSSRAVNSSDAESRQAYLESLMIRRRFCGDDPSELWNEARAEAAARAFTNDSVASAPDKRFDLAIQVIADESLVDAVTTLHALDAVRNVGYETAAALPVEAHAAVARLLQAADETADPIMRAEILKRLTTHRAVAEASGLFGSINEMRKMDLVSVSAEERRMAAQAAAVELYVCRSAAACGPGTAFGLRFVRHSPFAARGYEAYRRDQVPPLLWREIEDIARRIEAARSPGP